MKATIRETYGGPEVLEVRDVVAPHVAAGEVLIEVAAASLNAADIQLLRGTPAPARLAFGLRKPRRPGMGTDVAGRVSAVGAQVTEFKEGARVTALTSAANAQNVEAIGADTVILRNRGVQANPERYDLILEGVRLFEGGDVAGKIVFQRAGLNTPAAVGTK